MEVGRELMEPFLMKCCEETRMNAGGDDSDSKENSNAGSLQNISLLIP